MYLEHHLHYILACEQQIESESTRFNQLVELARNIHPDDSIGKLQWVWLVAVCCTSKSSLDGTEHNHFPRNKLPNGDNWHGGIQTNANVDLPNKQIAEVTAQSTPLAQQLKSILNSNLGKLAKILGRSSHTFDPRIPLSFLSEESR